MWAVICRSRGGSSVNGKEEQKHGIIIYHVLCFEVFLENTTAPTKTTLAAFGLRLKFALHSSADSRKVKENAKERWKDFVNVKILTFSIEVYVSCIAPCVNPSENTCRGPMGSTFDEVGFQIKIYTGGCFSF